MRDASVFARRVLTRLGEGQQRAIARVDTAYRSARRLAARSVTPGPSHRYHRFMAHRVTRLSRLTARRGARPALGVALLISLAILVIALPGTGPAVGRTGPPGTQGPHIAALRGDQQGGTGLTGSLPFAAAGDSLLADALPTAAPPAPARLGPDGMRVVVPSMTPPPLVFASYTVRDGDTLYSIAARFGLNFGSIFWANKLVNPRLLHVGQVLRIPPVDGVVYTVRAGDTLESIATRYGVTSAAIADFNQLTDGELPVGVEIMVPNAHGPAIPQPPAPSPSAPLSAATGSTSSYGGAFRGSMVWPVRGWNYISQYFWSGHQAIDIASRMGTPVVAAAAGRVLFAGWGNNGGGYQVWISHGSNVSTTYNHMSAVLVRVGQFVAAGQQVGRIGMTGWATGPHLHFEIWIGRIWDGGYRVNPLLYLR